MSAPAPEPLRVGSFQVGALCPSCQVPLALEEAYVSCSGCSALHHAACWTGRGGQCASYHCDRRTSAAPAAVAPPSDRIRVSKDEVERVVVAPPRPRFAAPPPGPPRPVGRSRTAVAGLLLAVVAVGAALVGARGEVHQAAVAVVVLASLVLALAAGLLSSLGLGTILVERRARGLPFAALGLVLALGAAAVNLWGLARGTPRALPGQGLSLVAPEPPNPETFASAPPPIANAMQANVFVAGEAAGMSWCGAGVILGASDGEVLILTNRHVVAPTGVSGHRLQVTFASGELAPGDVQWQAPDGVDLAILASRPRQLPPVVTRLRRRGAQVSEHVFAIGNPMALSWSYSDGAVSRVHADHLSGGARVEIIQSQTPLQSGNSGGGLYDLQGRLVGVNTWSASPLDGQGPGFAISARTVATLVPERFLAVTERSDE